jgi:hypothetical protein
LKKKTHASFPDASEKYGSIDGQVVYNKMEPILTVN